MLTKKDFCDYETCVALRELGFTLDMTEKVYERNLMANRYETTPKPLLYEAQKWLREEKKIEVVVLGEKEIGGPYYADLYTENGYAGYVRKSCEKYEEALFEGIKGAVKLLINNKNE